MFRRPITAGVVALAVTLGFTAPVVAETAEDGITAYGRGDYTTAMRLLRPLAEQDQSSFADRITTATAQYLLGTMYYLGKEVPQDHMQAVLWTRRAAEQGHAAAQMSLGGTYLDGKGVPQDRVQALMWFDLAASVYDDACEVARKDREDVIAKMTPAQIAEAQRLAREWKPKSN
jgi:TPR repeat protein